MTHIHNRDCYDGVDAFQRFHYCIERPNVYYDSVKKTECIFSANLERFLSKRDWVEWFDTRWMTAEPLTPEERVEAQSRERSRRSCTPLPVSLRTTLSKTEIVAFAFMGSVMVLIFLAGAFSLVTGTSIKIVY